MITGIENNALPYFILRALVSKEQSDRLSAKSQAIATLSVALEKEILNGSDPSTAICNIFSRAAPDLKSRSKNVEKRLSSFKEFLILNVTDENKLKILSFIFKYVVSALNQAVDDIPDSEFLKIARNEAKIELSTNGDRAISSLINNWDDFTLRVCLSAENDIAKKLFEKIDTALKGHSETALLSSTNLLVSVLQEFERRAGQKRKGRSGADLHYAVSTILDHIGIPHSADPHLVTGAIEADLVINHGSYKCLVSCKRTGRERVKQTLTDINELHRLRIRKVIWFFTHFDQSKDRVIDMGSRGNLIYLPDNLDAFKQLSADIQTKDYVLPLSTIRETLPNIIRGHYA